MPNRPPRPCSKCGAPATHHGMCQRHNTQQRRHTDDARGTARQRGYDETHRTRFRQAVLDRDGWVCIACGGDATVADHYPMTRRELLAAGLDANDPQHGRSMCPECHNRHTAKTSTTPGNLRRG